MKDTVHLAADLVGLIENQDEPYEDLTIRAIIEGEERYRIYHPVALFSAIQFIDELAQIVKPKRIAEMEAKEAWVWEMRRVMDHIIDQTYQDELSKRPLIADMYRRIIIIINQERRKYES